MVADKYERYAIAHVPEGLQISLWQALPSLGFGLIALVILMACFLTDPYQSHGRIWTGLGVVALGLVALFGVRIENWIISDSAIRYKSSIWSEELLSERSPGTLLNVRIEHIPCDSDETPPPFPHVVHLIGPGGLEIGDGFRFRTSTNLDRFLETLCEVLPIEVEYLPSRDDKADEAGKPLGGLPDPWPD
jgi:hypothetical protein